MVALLAVQFGVAWTMPEIHRGTVPEALITWHLSLGATILTVVLARLGWRATHRPPPAPKSLPAPLRLLSRATHYGLYALLIVLPVLGWANASSRGWPVKLFGLIALPPLVPTGSALGHQLGDVHKALATGLLALIALHTLGALYHGVVLRDRTLQRMLPFTRAPATGIRRHTL